MLKNMFGLIAAAAANHPSSRIRYMLKVIHTTLSNTTLPHLTLPYLTSPCLTLLFSYTTRQHTTPDYSTLSCAISSTYMSYAQTTTARCTTCSCCQDPLYLLTPPSPSTTILHLIRQYCLSSPLILLFPILFLILILLHLLLYYPTLHRAGSLRLA